MTSIQFLNRLQGKKVLVVDDVVDNQILECVYLKKLGAVSDVASNGLEAFHKAIHGDHDMVLMDLHMPVLDGMSATQRLRNAGYAKPIIAITADTQEETKSRAFEVGFTDFLHKPLLFQTLIKALLRSIESFGREKVL